MTARGMTTSSTNSTKQPSCHQCSRVSPMADNPFSNNQDNQDNDYNKRSHDDDDDDDSCSQSRVFIAIACTLTVISIAASTYVGYLLTTQGLRCDCALRAAYITPATTAITIDYEQVEKSLETQIKNLREKVKEENKTDSPFDRMCGKKTAKECQTEVINNLKSQVANIKKKLELLINERTTEQYKDLEEERTGIQEMTNTIKTVEEPQSPQCVWKMKNESGIEGFLKVIVPQKSKNLVTMSISCSTSVSNVSVAKVVEVKTVIPQFYCHCRNNNQEESYINCIVHYWQCNIHDGTI